MKRFLLTLLLLVATGNPLWADFLFKAGSFSTGTGAAATTIPVTGVGFQGKALMLFWNGRTDTTDAVGRSGHRRGIGFATSSTDRKCKSGSSQDADGVAADTGQLDTDVEVIRTVQEGGSFVIVGAADFTTWDSDGFTLTVTTAFTTSTRVGYCAWGGSDITNVTTFTFNVPVSTNGNYDITTIGFQPDCVFLLGSKNASAFPAATTDDHLTFGAFDGTNQGVLTVASNDAATTTLTKHYSYAAECVALLDASVANTEDRGSCSTMLSTGFRINFLDTSALARYVHGLAFKGGKWQVGNSATRTDTTPWAVTGLGAQPKGGIIFSSTAAFSTQDTPATPDSWTMGAFSSASSRVVVATLDETAIANTTEIETAIDFDEVYDNIDTSAAIQGQMDISSIDSDGVTWVMDDADPSAAGFVYVLFGPSTSQSVVPLAMEQYRRRR